LKHGEPGRRDRRNRRAPLAGRAWVETPRGRPGVRATWVARPSRGARGLKQRDWTACGRHRWSRAPRGARVG